MPDADAGSRPARGDARSPAPTFPVNARQVDPLLGVAVPVDLKHGLAEGGRDQLADRVLARRLRVETAKGEHQTAADHGALQILAVIEAVTLDLIAIALSEPLAHIGVPIGHRVAGVLQSDDAAPVQLGEYGAKAVAVGHTRP